MNLFAMIFCLSGIYCSSWNVTVQLNPGCKTECGKFNIVHVCGRHVNYSAHFLLAASEHIGPSVLALYSSEPDAELGILWDVLANDTDHPTEAIQLAGVKQSYSIVFTQLVEYDDQSNQADMSKLSSAQPDTYHSYAFNHFNWSLWTRIKPDPYTLNPDEILPVVYVGESSEPIFRSDSSVKLVFMLSNADQHNRRMPSLRFVPGLSLQFELQLLNLHTNYTAGRFATQLAFVSQDPVGFDQDFVQTTVFSINDEVAPGIFKVLNLRLGERTYRSSPVAASKPGGFVQTRPVCYVSDQNLNVKTSRDVQFTAQRDALNHSFVRPNSLNRSLPYWYYAAEHMRSVGVRVQNVSFGTSEDGFYAQSNCIVWSASFGFGEPPTDSFSPLLIGLLCLSAVIVLGSLLAGALLFLCGRFRRHRTPETEPLLPEPAVTI